MQTCKLAYRVNSNAFGDAGAEILARALSGNSTVTNME